MRLIGLLNDAQAQHGYLSQDTLRQLAKEANVPLHRLQQLVSFYPSFRTTPPPRVELAVCRDMSCYLAGRKLHNELKELAGDGVEVHEVSCIGRCDRAPIGMLNHEPIPLSDFEQVKAWVANPDDGAAVRPTAAITMEDRSVPDARIALSGRSANSSACRGPRARRGHWPN